ncbi:MAG: hypothetical protein IKC05_01975 [Lentisphaeria bacterium]|nr:hypothetical protein [Lentisphaeria bacterium]MBR2910356.1 hypothetical protein [Lentisphaeria bacterium]
MAGETGRTIQMFFNQYERALDPQCRISLPSDWRSKDGDTEFVMFPAVGKALVLVPGDVLSRLFEKLQDESITDPQIQMAFAYLGSQARVCRCDKQGRLPLDREKLASIGVSGQVLMLGSVSHIRLCAPENWNVPADESTVANCLSELRKADSDTAKKLAGMLNSITTGK